MKACRHKKNRVLRTSHELLTVRAGAKEDTPEHHDAAGEMCHETVCQAALYHADFYSARKTSKSAMQTLHTIAHRWL